ncbi:MULTISPECIES: crossover junction endodeoxyribonuclease RuvC [Arthrobacter]|uniref:Crossover junction endodeoxyribonuclease RuvC n=1 Tax=Arthrobacter jinronghuae TaxID=2964609 RepID=A0ABT1NUZ6_9MICC|nr:crossover junction endodeoxyribonuclease RuvC [Arthrobacter jinronghuae]MCC9174506.1 crossover junction endodeoxyribonuclease RuvC [Arthrobacter sp. zg-Y179]MCQ1953234.1 crossover junction endodeoxyribonuclease RuvC [Arthrobacter sp. zg-Y238]MCQ1950366.1 crossover junction endodeoxyribonuclease RuvC [Arthrobacter jinronghuae]MCQ1956477.1 crossover junction endodeoxyribonuclease RuvC [Arthrobacter jinronghuae]UWX77342.1 crossover junction endodeoxyribonuclease RuvC [Arthrobacter jinronghuae]
MSLRVLGVDPGLTRCGLGVVEVEGNRRATLVAVGVVGTVAGTALDARLLVISEAIELWLDTHRPDVLAVERVFSQLNVSTVMGTAQASGVVIAAAARRGIPVALHTPTEVKAAVTGSGSANKDAVGKMVTKILRLDEMPKPADAADALALAITHAWRRGVAGPGPTAGSASRGTAPATGLTPAQRLWAEAEARAKRGSY